MKKVLLLFLEKVENRIFIQRLHSIEVIVSSPRKEILKISDCYGRQYRCLTPSKSFSMENSRGIKQYYPRGYRVRT